MSQPQLPPDHHQRERILTELDRCILVEAAAGTGKTTSMVGRMVALVRTGVCPIDHLAAVTFTRKAAAELRSRFQIELERAASAAVGEEAERLAVALSHVDRCFVGTIHSFCARLLRERPIEAGVSLAFEEMDDAEDRQLRAQAWQEYASRLSAEGTGPVAELREVGLGLEQIEEAFYVFAEYADIDEWPTDPAELGDLKRLARDVAQYVKHMEALIPTFPKERGNDRLMEKYERTARLVRNSDLACPAELFQVLELFTSSAKTVQRIWPEGREQGKCESERWTEFSEKIAGPALRQWYTQRYAIAVRVLRDAVGVYDRLRQELGVLNYQDLLLGAARLLRDNPQVRKYFRSRFSHLFVDEFQDTDPIQAQVIMLLTAEDPTEKAWRQCRPVPGSLFVVGDPKQSIYRFRRADIVTYNQFKEIIARHGGLILSLSTNFRTREDLVTWANRVFQETFPSQADEYSPAVCDLQVGRRDTITGDLENVRVLRIPAECENNELVAEHESNFLASYIRQALDAKLTVPRTAKELQTGMVHHATPGDFLVVSWNKRNLAIYGRRLQELGIPHEVSGGKALQQIPELRLLADCLRALAEPENSVALVAVLRGRLFGFSDEQLYQFKRAGGRFHFRSRLPEEIPSELASRFQPVFDQLRDYARWIAQLPLIAAVERIIGHLGLLPLVLASTGGNLQAGCIAKVLEMLRSAHADLHSLADLVEFLHGLIEDDIEFDGTLVRPHEGPAVRLMNLHKVKGLEAPVVFLADPTGKWSPPVSVHIDRTGVRAKGFLAVLSAADGNGHRKLLACPANWEDHSAEESRFTGAEKHRLFYVAATRAGCQLVVSQRHTKNGYNHWSFFEPHLADYDELTTSKKVAAPKASSIKLSGKQIAAQVALIESRCRAVEGPTYATAAAKEISLAASSLHRKSGGHPQGTEWGTVIHLLLQVAMRESQVDLTEVAFTALQEQGLSTSLVDDALATVKSVMGSELWRRAQASPQCLVEVPFTTLMQPAESLAISVPTVLRGAIDLAFREGDGWILADYKTDPVSQADLPLLVDHYRPQLTTYAQAWEQMVRERVTESGLYFVRAGVYVRV